MINIAMTIYSSHREKVTLVSNYTKSSFAIMNGGRKNKALCGSSICKKFQVRKQTRIRISLKFENTEYIEYNCGQIEDIQGQNNKRMGKPYRPKK